MVNIPKEWIDFLEISTQFSSFENLLKKVERSYLNDEIFPKKEMVFRAFEVCNLFDLKVVILGQDPYHTPGVANGLAFSTFEYNPIPPSLRNIFKEISLEFGEKSSINPDLSRWSEQGVLLLNTSLTVKKGEPMSHKNIGWENFTNFVIQKISVKKEKIVFILWGNFARSKKEHILKKDHLILESAHPSPFSANSGFFGNNHFKLCNEFLLKNGYSTIRW